MSEPISHGLPAGYVDCTNKHQEYIHNPAFFQLFHYQPLLKRLKLCTTHHEALTITKTL
jgi:hypothetical protein